MFVLKMFRENRGGLILKKLQTSITRVFLKKKLCLIILMIVILFTTAQVLCWEIEKQSLYRVDLEKVSANYNDYSDHARGIDNHVLVRKANGIGTFPFVFGERLYLYDIDKQKYRLVDSTYAPFSHMGVLLLGADNKIFYNKTSELEESVDGKFYYNDLNKKSKLCISDEQFYFVDLQDGFSVYNNQLYCRKENEDDVYDITNGSIYVMDLEKGEFELFEDGNISYMEIIDNNLYFYDIKTKTLSVRNLDTGEKMVYRYEKNIEDIEYTNEGKFLVLSDEGVFCSDNLESIESKEKLLINDKGIKPVLHYRDGLIYYQKDIERYDDGGYWSKVYCYDIEKDESKEVLDIVDIMPFLGTEEYSFSNGLALGFCDDYIVIEMYYASEEGNRDHAELLIYDYNGNLVQKKKLW